MTCQIFCCQVLQGRRLQQDEVPQVWPIHVLPLQVLLAWELEICSTTLQCTCCTQDSLSYLHMEKYSAFRIVVVDNYNHFYGQGGQAEKGKCPLWSDNANLHRFQKIGRFSLVQIS